MQRFCRAWRRSWFVVLLVTAWLAASVAQSSVLVMKDGRRLEGKFGKVAGLAENPLAPSANRVPTITFVDDGLRRVFIPTLTRPDRPVGVLRIEQAAGEVKEKIGLEQRVAN